MEINLEQRRQEIFTSLQHDTNLKQEEIEEIYRTKKDEIKHRGIPYGEEEIEERAIGYLQSHLKNLKAQKLFPYEVYLVGYQVTDYAFSSKYNRAVTDWDQGTQDQKERLIKEGIVNHQGQPLYTSGFAKGNIIEDPESNWEKIYFGKGKDETGKVVYTIIHDKFYTERYLPLFKVLKVSAKKAAKSTEALHDLSIPEIMKYEIVDKEGTRNIPEELAKIFKSHLYFHGTRINLALLQDWHNEFGSDRNTFFICEANLIRRTPTNKGRNDVLVVDDLSLGSDNNGVTMFLSKDIEKSLGYYFGENIDGIYVIGGTSINKKDNSLQINGFGIWIPEYGRQQERPDKISKQPIQEITKKPEEALQKATSEELYVSELNQPEASIDQEQAW